MKRRRKPFSIFNLFPTKLPLTVRRKIKTWRYDFCSMSNCPNSFYSFTVHLWFWFWFWFWTQTHFFLFFSAVQGYKTFLYSSLVLWQKKLECLKRVETNPSNICKHLYFPYGHPFLSPHGTTLTAFDMDVCRENKDVRWVGFHPPECLSQIILIRKWNTIQWTSPSNMLH